MSKTQKHFNEYMEMLAKPVGQGWIAEAIGEMGDTEKMALAVQNDDPTRLGGLVAEAVKLYLWHLVERDARAQP